MKIRNYNDQDYLDVVSILREADLFDDVWDSKENLVSMIGANPRSILVAEVDNIVVGNLFIVPYGNKVSYLFRLAVKTKFRKQGIASELIEKAEEIIRQSGVSEIGLYVDSGNFKLHGFYRRRGFKISSKTYHYMWKEL